MAACLSREGLEYLKSGTLFGEPRTPSATGLLTIIRMGIVGPNHWFREGDARFNPANIVIDSRNANFTAIIEKKTGSIVWRLGPYYPEIKRGAQVIPRPVDQISGQHDAHIIPDGLPAAGNLLLFDDQG